DLKGDNQALADLIKAQKQIKYVKLHIQSNLEEYENIAKALEKHACSIVHLELWITKCFKYFPDFLLSKLINLQILLLHDINQYANHQEIYQKIYQECLIKAHYFKLEIL